MCCEIYFLLIAEQMCIACSIDLAVERGSAAVGQIKDNGIVGIHVDIETEIAEIGMMHCTIQPDFVLLIVIHDVMRESDGCAIHVNRVMHIVPHSGERYDHAYPMRFGFGCYPCLFLPPEHVHMS